MNFIQIYIITADSIFILFFFYHCYIHICQWVQNQTLWFIFKHFIYPILLKQHWFIKPYIYWQCLLLISYWIDTVSCNMIRVHIILHFGSRADILSVLNIIPLFFSDQLSLATDLLGLSFCSYQSIHSTVAYITLIQNLIHIIITIC